MNTRIAGGTKKGRLLKASRTRGLRPTTERVRAAIFSMIGEKTIQACNVLDLYAGTGAMGIEALSRGAGWVDFVETNPALCRDIVKNLEGLGLSSQAKVHARRVNQVMNELNRDYELILIDPPYETDPWADVMGLLLENGLVSKGSTIVAEHSSRHELDKRFARLVCQKNRRYGDTAVSIFILEENI